MPARFSITNFSRGEFGPQLYGRVDVPHYSAGAKQLKNFIVQRYGGVRFRDGFRFVAPIFETDLTKKVKLLPFQYSIDQAYVLVMRNSVMNVAAFGGMVLEEDLKITAITNGTTALLTVPFHGMAVGDDVYLTGNVGVGNKLEGRFAKVTQVPSASMLRVDVDTTGAAALTSSTGITRSGAPAPPPPPEPPPPAPPPPPPPPDTGGGEGTGGGGGAPDPGGIQGPQDPDGWYALP